MVKTVVKGNQPSDATEVMVVRTLPRPQTTWVHILALPFTSCVTLSRLLNFHVVQYTVCDMGILTVTTWKY